MPIRKTIDARVPVKIWTEDVDENSILQLQNTAAMPFVFHHVAAMPDVHLGIGATVGSVIATKGAICPAAVGVDIGCGMMAALTNIPVSALEGKLPQLRHAIERGVPVGFQDHRTPTEHGSAWVAQTEAIAPFVASKNELKKSEHQLGTLGGGNHFIEVCTYRSSLTSPYSVAVLLHSGSRGIGNKTAQKHIEKAKGIMRQMFVSLPDPDLAYFAQGTEEFKEYIHDLEWCQEYAKINREIMMWIVLDQLSRAVDAPGRERFRVLSSVNCHHNYVSWESHCATCIDIHGSDSQTLARLLVAKFSRVRDFLVGYRPVVHSCGGLLLTASTDDREVLPSQLDAQARTGLYMLVDLLGAAPVRSHLSSPAGLCECVAPARTAFSSSNFLSSIGPEIVRQAGVRIDDGKRDSLLERFFFDAGFDPSDYITRKCERGHDVHNVMVTRKGAIRARVGDMGIIPGSMGVSSYIVRGLGNPESFNSAPHGAGRRMSRTKARKTFTKADLELQTTGIECRKDEGVLDEIPGAYKPIEEVMGNSSDLVEVVTKLDQLLVVKG
jgi:RNA-splicing ligase RtcB